MPISSEGPTPSSGHMVTWHHAEGMPNMEIIQLGLALPKSDDM